MKRFKLTYGRQQTVSTVVDIILAILLLSDSVFAASTLAKPSDHPDDQSCFVLPGNSVSLNAPVNTNTSRSRQKWNSDLHFLSISYCEQNKCEYESMSANYRLTRYSRAHHVVHHQLLI